MCHVHQKKNTLGKKKTNDKTLTKKGSKHHRVRQESDAAPGGDTGSGESGGGGDGGSGSSGGAVIVQDAPARQTAARVDATGSKLSVSWTPNPKTKKLTTAQTLKASQRANTGRRNAGNEMNAFNLTGPDRFIESLFCAMTPTLCPGVTT